MSRSTPRAAGVLVVLLTVAGLVLSGCATLPDSSSPQAIGTLERGPATTEVAAPVPGREPDLLLRDFLQASTDPTNRHRAARQNGFAADAGVARHQTFDVHGRLRGQSFQRLRIGKIVDPATHAE